MRSSRSLCQGKRAEQEAGGKKAGEADAANVVVSSVVSSIDRQDGLQNIRRAGLHAGAYYYGPHMRLRRTIREVTYHFEDLRDLLAKASPYRSGDALAGIAAESGEERAAAQMTLADLPLQAFLQKRWCPTRGTKSPG